LVGTAVTIALSPVLIHRFGATGAALGSSVAYAAGLVYSVQMFLKRSDLGLYDLLTPRASDLRGLLQARLD
jgi:Na+-driven multidrug efflux pump